MFRASKAQLKAKASALRARRAFVIALLLAFILQGQLVASHFHLLSANASTAGLADAGKAAPQNNHKKAPVEDDCPICQQLASAHNLLLYSAVSPSLPELIGSQPFEAFDERAPVALIALNWRSRAPPL